MTKITDEMMVVGGDVLRNGGHSPKELARRVYRAMELVRDEQLRKELEIILEMPERSADDPLIRRIEALEQKLDRLYQALDPDRT